MTKKGLALTLAAVMVWAVAVPAFGQVLPFRDVSRDHWAYEAVQALAEAGLVEGYPDGTFGGERTFTRYEMAMVFARILARLEQLLEDQIHATVDDRIADLWAAIQELRAWAGIPSAPGEPGALGATGIRPPIVVDQQTREDGTVETVVRLSPELEDAIRAIAADQFRKELGSTAAETIAQLLDEATLRALIDARANELAGHIAALANEFQGELELLGVRVTELERLFATLESRVAALEQQVAEARSAAETAQGVADAAAASARAAEEAAQRARERAEAAWRLVERLRAAGASEGEIDEAIDLADSAEEAA
ncbi:MAG TPA: S-layer homology domain-containing protein, partial [Limnochordales bacterium]